MMERDRLEQAYALALKYFESQTEMVLPDHIKAYIDEIVVKINSNKSLVSALMTSLLKKIIAPDQDIRLHQTKFEGGYSARVLDTKYIAPFFKDYFPRYANKESAFLTLATREQIPWTLNEGVELKIRDQSLKNSFLNILHEVQVLNANPNDILIYLLTLLIHVNKEDEFIYNQLTISPSSESGSSLNINGLLDLLKNHFASKNGSRLPVLAIYTLYEIFMPDFKRFEHKILKKLQVHTSSDKHGYGDIEIYDENDYPFELIEIKHNIPINKHHIFDIVQKMKGITFNRYYILTTYESVFENPAVEKEVVAYLEMLKTNIGIDIIANGILGTIKYYLRFVNNYRLFIDKYAQNLVKDAQFSTEVKHEHITLWSELIRNINTSD